MKYHRPVLLKESVDALVHNPNGVYVDVTFGGGGHSREILSRLSEKGRLYSFDQDLDALNNAIDDSRFTLINQNFRFLENSLLMYGITKVDGILGDLGVSSHQFDEAGRGFSIRSDAPLDMRMNALQTVNAQMVVNDYDEERLADILYYYGELREARKLAREVVHYRKNKKIETTIELADIVIKAIGKSMKKHPAKRTFQAIRIFVNRELEVLENTLDKAIKQLNSGGRLLVITFHSLEDRMVKEKFRNYENPCTCPEDIPICICENKSLGKVLTRKAIKSTDSELENNNRAHSAKLRVFLKESK